MALDRLLTCATALVLSSAIVPTAHSATLINPQFSSEMQSRQASLRGINAPAAEELLDIAPDNVKHHLKESLNSEDFGGFKLFIYVNKARIGPRSQHMYVFEKTDNGDLNLLHDWPVSTGRERLETDPHGHRQSTATPSGFYQLDAGRLYERHTSGQWDEPMPY